MEFQPRIRGSPPGKGKKRRRKPHEEKEEKKEVRRWDSAPEKILRNVKYTNAENERLYKALQDYCAENDKQMDELVPILRDEAQNRGSWVWGRIAKLAQVETRSVKSLSQRLRRILFAKQGGAWSEEQVEALVDECLTSGERQHKWKAMAARIGKSPEMCRDKWKHLYGRKKRGAWSKHEVWALRQAVCELTSSLAPVSNVPWKKVQTMLPHRTSEQCRKKWFMDVLPQLLQYQNKHGQPIDTDIFTRVIVRKLKKEQVENIEMVDWLKVNKWWPAMLSKAKWKRLQRTVPESLEDAPCQEVVEWLFKSLGCEGHKNRDKRVLKHAELVLDAEARQMSDEEEKAEIEVDGDDVREPEGKEEKEDKHCVG